MAKILSAIDIEMIVDAVGIDVIMDRAIVEIEAAMKAQSELTVDSPVRSGFYDVGLVEWMPIHLRGKAVVIKLVSYFPDNPDRGRPTIQAMISRYCTRTGELTDVIEGGMLTAIRTGAASAVASRALARADSAVLGLIGCGAQAVTQAHAMVRCFPIRTILAYDICSTAVQSLRDRLAFLEVDIVAAAAHQCASASDILCTATSNQVGAGPVFHSLDLRDHLHINAVGSDFPGKIELPRAALAGALIVPDHRNQAVREGECQQVQADEIGPELTELVKAPSRWSSWRDRRTIFDSTGIPLEDAVMAELVCDLATSLGIGREIIFNATSDDPRDPYAFLTSRISRSRLSARVPV